MAEGTTPETISVLMSDSIGGQFMAEMPALSSHPEPEDALIYALRRNLISNQSNQRRYIRFYQLASTLSVLSIVVLSTLIAAGIFDSIGNKIVGVVIVLVKIIERTFSFEARRTTHQHACAAIQKLIIAATYLEIDYLRYLDHPDPSRLETIVATSRTLWSEFDEIDSKNPVPSDTKVAAVNIRSQTAPIAAPIASPTELQTTV